MNNNLRGFLRLSLLLVLAVMLSGCFLLQELGFVPPDTPVGLVVTNATASSLDVSWQSAIGAESYQVYRSTSETGPWTTTAFDGQETAFTDIGLDTGTTYYYVVRATNAAGSSINSEVVSGVTTGTVATPVISPSSSESLSSSTTYWVEITCSTPGASIYYTTDSSTPTASSLLYSGTFSFYTNFYPPLYIRAIAVKTGWTDSEEAITEYYWDW
jgi:hypothetical protein